MTLADPKFIQGANNVPTIDILLVTFRNLADIKVVISLLYRNTVSSFRLLVADNGMDPEILQYLHTLAAEKGNVCVIENPENKWCCFASNQLLRLIDATYAVFLCSYEAFVLKRGWDLEFLAEMDANPRAGLGGYLISSSRYLTGRDYRNQEFFRRFRNQTFVHTRLNDAMFHVQGGVLILRKSMYDQIGGFNEDLRHDYMDVEYSYYVESEGWQLLALPGVLSIHRSTRPNLDAHDLTKYSVVHPLSVKSVTHFLPDFVVPSALVQSAMPEGR